MSQQKFLFFSLIIVLVLIIGAIFIWRPSFLILEETEPKSSLEINNQEISPVKTPRHNVIVRSGEIKLTYTNAAGVRKYETYTAKLFGRKVITLAPSGLVPTQDFPFSLVEPLVSLPDQNKLRYVTETGTVNELDLTTQETKELTQVNVGQGRINQVAWSTNKNFVGLSVENNNQQSTFFVDLTKPSTIPLSNMVFPLAITDQKIYSAREQNKIVTLNETDLTGKHERKLMTLPSLPTHMLATKDKLVVAYTQGEITLIDILDFSGKQLKRFQPDGKYLITMTVSPDDSQFLIATLGQSKNILSHLDLKSLQVTKLSISIDYGAVTFDQSNNLIFAQVNKNVITILKQQSGQDPKKITQFDQSTLNNQSLQLITTKNSLYLFDGQYLHRSKDKL